MRNFHIQSVILGLGMGIVLTSLLSMIYVYGAKPMSKEEIMFKAREYGMVQSSELISGQQSTVDDKKNIQHSGSVKVGDTAHKPPTGDTGHKPTPSDAGKATADAPQTSTEKGINSTPIPPSPANELVDVSIEPGNTSEVVAEKLFKAGLITNKKDFLKELDRLNLTTEIVIGKYKLKKGVGLDTIIKAITM